MLLGRAAVIAFHTVVGIAAHAVLAALSIVILAAAVIAALAAVGIVALVDLVTPGLLCRQQESCEPALQLHGHFKAQAQEHMAVGRAVEARLRTPCTVSLAYHANPRVRRAGAVRFGVLKVRTHQYQADEYGQVANVADVALVQVPAACAHSRVIRQAPRTPPRPRVSAQIRTPHRSASLGPSTLRLSAHRHPEPRTRARYAVAAKKGGKRAS